MIYEEVGYFYAYELFGQRDPEIIKFVENLPFDTGTDNPMDNHKRDFVCKLMGRIIDNLSFQNLKISEIKRLNNLLNLPEDEYTLKEVEEASGTEDYRNTFVKSMLKRDKRHMREREFDLEEIIDSVINGDCEPPMLLTTEGKTFVIDGRTRLYAAIAANTDINVRVIDSETFKEAM